MRAPAHALADPRHAQRHTPRRARVHTSFAWRRTGSCMTHVCVLCMYRMYRRDDGVHLTPLGYEGVAISIFTTLQPLLQKK